jgi:hypothetical protein
MLKWIKYALLDVGIMVLILLGASFDLVYIRVLLYIYSPLILIAKAIVLFSPAQSRLNRINASRVPHWFYHLLYGVNILVLAWAAWWYLLAMWIGIWAFSLWFQLKSQSAHPSSGIKRRR